MILVDLSYIPSKDTSRDIILKLVERLVFSKLFKSFLTRESGIPTFESRWLAKDPTNVVHLQCAFFGYEHIFMGIHKKFKTKVHIITVQN